MLHKGTLQQLEAEQPFDRVFYQVERRGGAWGWFEASPYATRFTPYSGTLKRLAEAFRQGRAVEAAKNEKVALVMESQA